jgi:hypothetical protein
MLAAAGIRRSSFRGGSAEKIITKFAGEKQHILPSREHEESSRELSVNGPEADLTRAVDQVRGLEWRESKFRCRWRLYESSETFLS